MKVVSFSCKSYDRQALSETFPAAWQTEYLEPALDEHTVIFAQQAQVVTVFVNDQCDAKNLATLAGYGVKMLALRCAGFNNVDLAAAQRLGIRVTRVPAYSPYAVAEHTIGLMLALNRKLYKAYNRLRDGNFALNGMLGFDMHGKTVGIIGAGRIGKLVAKMLQAFGCEVLVYDPYPCADCDAMGFQQVSLATLLAEAQMISLHCPLTAATEHMINHDSIAQMQTGVMLINTSRGGLMDAKALIAGLKSKKIGYLGIDVYEKEDALFFEDHSCDIIQDDAFERLLSFPNVLVTGHQAYFTAEALAHIAETTTANIEEFAALSTQQPTKQPSKQALTNEITYAS